MRCKDKRSSAGRKFRPEELDYLGQNNHVCRHSVKNKRQFIFSKLPVGYCGLHVKTCCSEKGKNFSLNVRSLQNIYKLISLCLSQLSIAFNFGHCTSWLIQTNLAESMKSTGGLENEISLLDKLELLNEKRAIGKILILKYMKRPQRKEIYYVVSDHGNSFQNWGV